MPSWDVSSDKFALLKWKYIFPSCRGERMWLLVHSRALRFFQIWESQRPGSMWWLTTVLSSLDKRSDHRLTLKGLHERPHQRPQEASREPEASSYTQNKACLPKKESALRALDISAPIQTSRNQSQLFAPENLALPKEKATLKFILFLT